jgi:MFS family permease
MSGTLLIFMGKAVDRFGQRKMMLIAASILGLTALFSSFVSSLAMIFVSYFFLRYFGQGSMTLIPNSLVPQWFEEKRTFAFSLAGLGNLLATLLVPAFNYWLISYVGWQNAWRLWSLALFVIFIPMSILFVINKPEDMGLHIDNRKKEKHQDIHTTDYEKNAWTLKEAMHSRAFWLIGIISLVVPMFTTGITFHFFSMMEIKGVQNEAASWIIGLVALPAAIMPLIARTFLDKKTPATLFSLTQFSIVLSVVFLTFFVSNSFTAIIFILFYGFSASIQSIAINTVYPYYYGRKHLGTIRAAATIFMVIGSALGPLPFGLGFDITGSYDTVLYGVIVFAILTTVLTFFIKKPYKV